MPLESHWRRLNRASEQLYTLDKSIQRWLDSDAYRIVKVHDPEVRRTAYIAHIGDMPGQWFHIVGEAVHSLRSALDHLAFALNAKGYADAHNGAEIPAERESKSSFPIFGNVSQAGLPKDGAAAFKTSKSHRDMPAGAVRLIETLQPYKRGKDFRRDPLWALHELSRVDKHRIDLAVTASGQEDIAFSGTISNASLGFAGGPVHDGQELSSWVTPTGHKELDIDYHFTGDVAFGETTPLRDQPVVATLKGIRDYLRFRVAFPLDRFL